MAPPLHSSWLTLVNVSAADALADLVAASLLRPPGDTRHCRLAVRAIAEGRHPGSAGWLERLATDVGISAGELVRNARQSGTIAMAEAEQRGIAAVGLTDERYPAWLRQIADPPLVLWVEGSLDSTGPLIAVVGSRRATPTGLATARRLGRELAAAGAVIVSGLARGVDGAAHQGALDAGGRTLAVLGSGVDVVYPREHRSLARSIAAGHGAIVSELVPGTPPLPHHFPLRNRVISGLSRAVLVVEASEKSGSLITARMAAEQGRDVLAVPGSIASGCYRGCHALIKDGARLVETVEDVLEEVGWASHRMSTNKSSQSNDLDGLIRAGEALTLDEIAARTGRQAADLLAELGQLEVLGQVRRGAGGAFVRLD